MLRLGLRAQLSLALLLVTAGAITSVGAIAVWQTRGALTTERYERAATLTASAGNLAQVALASTPALSTVRRVDLERLSSDLAFATGADEISFLDATGVPLAPRGSAGLATDAGGVASALAGAPPHARQRPGDAGGLRLVAYAPVRDGVLRATFAVDAHVDARLSRTRTYLIVLGAIDGIILLVAALLIVRAAIIRPVRDLEAAARKIAAGDLDTKVATRGPGELGELAHAFDRMTKSLREGRDSLIRSEKLAGIGRLAAGVAHEVGNPLAAILGYVETLLGETPERPIDPALRQEILTRVRGETERIHRIIKELLDYSRPGSATVGPVDVAAAVDAALSLVRAQPRGRAVEVDVRIPRGLPRVRATTDGLVQVLLNLLLNAVDALEAEGKVTIDARTRGGRVVIAVADNGPGIPAEARDKVFDPFFTTKEPGQGTGLGLAVSLAIIENYGGSLGLAPSDEGARFEIELEAIE